MPMPDPSRGDSDSHGSDDATSRHVTGAEIPSRGAGGTAHTIRTPYEAAALKPKRGLVAYLDTESTMGHGG